MSDALASIALSFGAGAAVGDGADDAAAAAAGMPRPCRKQPVFPFNLPPGILTATTVGSYLDLPHQFGPRAGWYWDITSLTASGFTAGAVAVTRNAPFITAAGNPVAIESVASFTSAGVITFPQHGNPLLDATERLVFTVTSAITGFVQISGTVIMVPVSRIDDYLS